MGRILMVDVEISGTLCRLLSVKMVRSMPCKLIRRENGVRNVLASDVRMYGKWQSFELLPNR